MNKLYLAGKMSGVKNYGYPLFNKMAAELRTRGYQVYNPAEADGGDTSKPFAYYLDKAYRAILSADGVAVLPNWKRSNGARSEVLVAQTLGKPVIDATTLLPIAETCWSVVRGVKWQPYFPVQSEAPDEHMALGEEEA